MPYAFSVSSSIFSYAYCKTITTIFHFIYSAIARLTTLFGSRIANEDSLSPSSPHEQT